jgi:Holliday junction resolvasome RuvABC endonuclease subunit
MIVLGVDVPGKRSGGWAVYDSKQDMVLRAGTIYWNPENSEREHYKNLGDLLEELQREYKFSIITVEHPFLYLIAQNIGAVKMWAALKPGVSWFQVTASSARKTVFGDAKRITRVTRTGSIVSGAKEFVLEEMKKRYSPEGELTQHEADAILYAVAAARRLEAPAITRRKE